MPAHAIIAPLSVHRLAGGTMSLNAWSWPSSVSFCAMAMLAATPPAMMSFCSEPSVMYWFSRNSSMARFRRSARASAAAAWKAAHRSYLSCWVMGWIFLAACSTAVFRPEKEKSQFLRPFIGRGRLKRLGSPCLAYCSTKGPPG